MDIDFSKQPLIREFIHPNHKPVLEKDGMYVYDVPTLLATFKAPVVVTEVVVHDNGADGEEGEETSVLGAISFVPSPLNVSRVEGWMNIDLPNNGRLHEPTRKDEFVWLGRAVLVRESNIVSLGSAGERAILVVNSTDMLSVSVGSDSDDPANMESVYLRAIAECLLVQKMANKVRDKHAS